MRKKTFTNITPWWSKITAKVILERLPVSYNHWKRFGLFEHGDMNRPQRAWETFILHARLAGVFHESPNTISFGEKKTGPFHVLELGPGDSLFSCQIALALGADSTWLVHTGRWATTDNRQYSLMRQYLGDNGLPVTDLDECRVLDDLLSSVSASHLVEGN